MLCSIYTASVNGRVGTGYRGGSSLPGALAIPAHNSVCSCDIDKGLQSFGKLRRKNMDVFMEDLPCKKFNTNITTFPKNKQLAELLR